MTKQENYPREKCECFKCSDGKCSGKTCAVGDVQVRRTDQDTSGQMPVSRCKCSGAKCSGDKYSQRLLYAVSPCVSAIDGVVCLLWRHWFSIWLEEVH